jgi:hypothetical protein
MSPEPTAANQARDDWRTLIDFMAREVIEYIVSRHPEVSSDDARRVYDLAKDKIQNTDVELALLLRIESHLGVRG